MTGLVPLAVFLAACGSTPPRTGVVLDIWGEPIEGATVDMGSGADRPLTDADGVFNLPATPGTLMLKAGKEGYIQEHLEFELTDAPDGPRPMLKLWKKPAEDGFFMVGLTDYQKLGGAQVEIIGAGASTVQGIKEPGNLVAEGELKVLWQTPLKPHQVASFNLELHKLEFIEKTKVMSVEGEKEVAVHLYTSTGAVDGLDVAPLHSSEHFLITAPDLDNGYYAFSSLNLLNMKDAEKFGQIPAEMREVHPLQFKK